MAAAAAAADTVQWESQDDVQFVGLKSVAPQLALLNTLGPFKKCLFCSPSLHRLYECSLKIYHNTSLFHFN